MARCEWLSHLLTVFLQGSASDASSPAATRQRSPTSVLRNSHQAGQEASQPSNGRKERVRPITRPQRRRQSQPQPKPLFVPVPVPAPKHAPIPALKPAPTQPAADAKLQASYKGALLGAAVGAVPVPVTKAEVPLFSAAYSCMMNHQSEELMRCSAVNSLMSFSLSPPLWAQ